MSIEKEDVREKELCTGIAELRVQGLFRSEFFRPYSHCCLSSANTLSVRIIQ